MFMDINGDPVADQNLLAKLSKPYFSNDSGESADVNLGSRPQLLAEFVDPVSFQLACRNVRDIARQKLADQPEFTHAIESPTKLASNDLQRRRNRLHRRQSAGDEMARKEIALIELILPSISRPAIRLDAMGCLILGAPLVVGG